MQKIRIPSEVLARLEARGRPTPPDLARCTVAQALAVFIEVEALQELLDSGQSCYRDYERYSTRRALVNFQTNVRAQEARLYGAKNSTEDD